MRRAFSLMKQIRLMSVELERDSAAAQAKLGGYKAGQNRRAAAQTPEKSNDED